MGLRRWGGSVAEEGDLQSVAVGLGGETAPQKPEEHPTQLTVQLPTVSLRSYRLPVPALTASLLKEVLLCRREGEGRREGCDVTTWVT